MNILGISAYYHDSAAAVVCDGKIVAAAQEERFTRIKHDAGFPANAVKYCLDEAGLNISHLDAVVFYDKPLLKFERLLETAYQKAPRGMLSFVQSMPVWVKDKLFLRKMLLDELQKIYSFRRSSVKLLFTEHHLAHAASAFFPSGYTDAAVLTIDGVGEWATASICKASGNSIEILKEMHFPHSLGLLYSAFTQFLGFRVNSGEYKLMGLAPYGQPDSHETQIFIDTIKKNLVHIYDDGSLKLNTRMFYFETGMKMIREKNWEKLFGFKTRLPEDEIGQHHCNLAFAIQHITNEVVLKMAHTARVLTGSDHLCLAGGVALNCVANGRLLRSGMFKHLFIQPAAGDAGGALGAALAVYYIYFGNELKHKSAGDEDFMKGAFLGPEYSDAAIEGVARKYRAVCKRYEHFETLADEAATLISKGNVMGWFQGRMEFGPRALGNRSILGDARMPEMQKKLNLKIKFREGFRPFAPSVLAEHISDYFEMNIPSPYMLLVANVKPEIRKTLPREYQQMNLYEKLYIQRSEIPAVTHVDFSARIQSVHSNTNERYYRLIEAYQKISGFSVIVNTSFNVRGEPIVCSPDDAYQCFMNTEMDYLVMGNYLFDKKMQPEYKMKGVKKYGND